MTELPTSVKLEAGMTIEDLDKVTGYAAFLEETQLETTRPHLQPLQLSEPSRYSDLLGHIYLHQSLLKHKTGQSVTIEEAAANWYDHVYRPAVTLIRKYDVLKRSEGRTETDLFLWLVDHLREVRQEFGEEAKSRTFSDALVDFLTEHDIPIPKDLLMEADPSVMLTDSQVMRAVKVVRDRERQKREDNTGE